MPAGLEIALSPERLDEGASEEQAAFGLFTIRTAQASLTEGFDFYVNGYRQGPLVSGYYAAEWFAWNWWRLRWEPRSAASNWALAHRMTSIGEGYVWPNIAIFSDGVRTALISNPSIRPDAKPFRYVGSLPVVVPSTLFEAAVDAFLRQIIGRLREQHVDETNLDRLWRDVLAERADPHIAKRRRLEALLGRDPDSIEDDAVERLIADTSKLGEAAVEEIAADRAQAGTTGGAMPTAEIFEHLARDSGYDASLRDRVRLSQERQPRCGADVPAWRMGIEAARALRLEQRLGEGPISNRTLAQLAGAMTAAITDRGTDGPDFSFTFDSSHIKSRIVLRSKWKVGRRFDLARLIGDELIGDELIVNGGALHPATRAFTYRQKVQRSFAAELLSPFEAVDDMLAGDYSQERQQDVSEHFEVSPMTINTLLKNHRLLERDDSEQDFDVAAIA